MNFHIFETRKITKCLIFFEGGLPPHTKEAEAEVAIDVRPLCGYLMETLPDSGPTDDDDLGGGPLIRGAAPWVSS